MAAEGTGAENVGAPVTKAELALELSSALQAHEATFLDKISSLLRPLHEQLDVIQKNLTETRNVAEGALKGACENRAAIQQIHVTEDLLAERTLRLDMSQRQNNLKLRGLGEKEADREDLTEHLTDWLNQQVGADRNISTALTKAFRLGPPALLKTKPSRDILITVMDYRYKNRILQVARKKGGIPYKNALIEIYPDLPKEALQKRRELKPVTNCLMEAGVKYIWATPLVLQFTYRGKSHRISNLEDGHKLLKKIDLDVPMDFNKGTQKRRHSSSPSPPPNQRRASGTAT